MILTISWVDGAQEYIINTKILEKNDVKTICYSKEMQKTFIELPEVIGYSPTLKIL